MGTEYMDTLNTHTHTHCAEYIQRDKDFYKHAPIFFVSVSALLASLDLFE